jgi:hypothetical protein
VKFKISKRWCEKSAQLEEGCASVEAGCPSGLGLCEVAAPAKRVRSGRLVVLSAEDARNLKAAASRRGYALPRFNRRTGAMLTAQWRSWVKLHKNRLATIEPDGGEAQDLVITTAGRMALRQHNNCGLPPEGRRAP